MKTGPPMVIANSKCTCDNRNTMNTVVLNNYKSDASKNSGNGNDLSTTAEGSGSGSEYYPVPDYQCPRTGSNFCDCRDKNYHYLDRFGDCEYESVFQFNPKKFMCSNDHYNHFCKVRN